MAAFTEGTPCWVDAQLPDLEAGKRFYAELFGWTYGRKAADHGPYPHYTDALCDGKPVAALAAKSDGRMPTTWGVYLATGDAAATARRIGDAGGRMITTPMPVDGLGTAVLAADPTGAVFGLWQKGERDGFALSGAPGSFCWTEVYTRDKGAVDLFYRRVFGFQGTELPDGAVDYLLWSPAGTEPGEDTAVVGRSVITDAFPVEMPGHFLVYFAVTDTDASAEHATRLGGRVTAPPFDTPHGRMAVLADDQGAAFAVLAAPGPGRSPAHTPGR
ncbi:VOC family protein [Streptomyces pacificus]|uniref:VOC family protein n=1 Tax=Streptomyces pacificus TaxID=2705029 RepID=A0A6A0B1Q0_9ACTN|nr:VOC family protein [Streptomyces pacificus]GFH38194.1 VOC family protein [Streptomyces pacificus]